MEGPTPVSALIHAATMVNAGVYFVARANPIFSLSAAAMVVVAAIGIFTAILAASIALTQTDIKRVLAYSTLSQLGYMFAALGVGAYVAAIFHLMAHGFFKGLLFLDSGSVIHGVHEEQDMNRMGGLWRKLPITHATMLIGRPGHRRHPAPGRLLQQGRDPGRAFKDGFLWVWLVGIGVAGLTAFYMFRLMGKTFYGPSHVDPAVEPQVHESPRSMTVPLDPAGHPVRPARPGPGPAVRRRRSSPAGSIRSSTHAEADPGPQPRRLRLLRLDGVLILISVTVAAVGHGHRHAPVRLPLALHDARDGTAAGPGGGHRPPACGRSIAASFHKWWFDELNDLHLRALRQRASRTALLVVRRARHRRRRQRHRPR